jgi:predicted transcriptional regulator
MKESQLTTHSSSSRTEKSAPMCAGRPVSLYRLARQMPVLFQLTSISVSDLLD